jgi:hypothetical protein
MVIFDKNKKDNFIKSKLQKQLQKQNTKTKLQNTNTTPLHQYILKPTHP